MTKTNTTWKIVLIVLGIIVIMILLGFVFIQTQINGAISLEQEVESSQSDINVQEKRRADLIPNLVECVKGYSEYEYNTLKDTIADSILKNWLSKSYKDFEHFETMHNYIDLENNIIRKGAVSAKSGEMLLIPINMRDGSLICEGKGDSDWNESAPHGAGRVYSRSKAKEEISLDEFKRSMEGIYTTCVGQSTIDESPMAYKSMDHILENISDTAEVKKIIKPVYNFKATS